ncbi:hypothetical protein [Burkholderia ubonensis]|uniref:hypothetical protein n=1 Tax=Burkholderia ubonensis TaxID=101571 RepID=UPI000AB8ACA0|nr:hypothetical protein [Burkholderia ubonensis]
MTILAVAVNSDGTIYQNPSGGINSYRQEEGIYVIEFLNQFSQPPVVVATQNYPNWNGDASEHGMPTDNAVLVHVDVNKAIILTGNSNGHQGGGPKAEDRNFTAVIVGA